MNRRALKTLIVDDEPIARRVLREQLETFLEVAIAGEAANGVEALLQIAALQPDLVFLDLQMPVMGGFEVVQNLGDAPVPIIVIVTAFDQHAIQAFEAGAIDYLLKPVSETRLHKAVERARLLRDHPIEVANNAARVASAVDTLAASTRKIVGRSGSEFVLLDPDEIMAFQAEGELVWIVTAKQRLLAAQTLRSIEQRLQQHQFQRVHRNAIVNVNHVRRVSALPSNRWLITLSNSLQITVSKRQAHHVRKILRW